MGLKDLVAQKSSLDEAAIEEIVKDYVRFDPDEKAIGFLPDASTLSNKNKVLMYLVSLQGWPFVSNEAIPVDAKPGEIEEAVGIQGGTLRPILKDLKDGHIIVERGGRYSVRAGSLAAIKSILGSNSGASLRPRRAPRRKGNAGAEAEVRNGGEIGKKSAARKSGLTDLFDGWIAGGFFDEPRTLGDVQKRFHKAGVIVPKTSIPKYLLRAVRKGSLERDEAEVNGKSLWTYVRGKK